MGQGHCRKVYFFLVYHNLPGGLTSSRVSGMKIITYGCDNMPQAFFCDDDRYHFPFGKKHIVDMTNRFKSIDTHLCKTDDKCTKST